MKTLHRIITYSATVLLLTALAACTDEERSNTPLVPTKEDIAFLGTVENGKDIATRASTVMNSEKFDYGDIYIYRERETEESGGEKKSEIQVYQVAPGEQGKLEVKESGDALKWEDAYDKQTFIAWTQPYPGSEEEESTPPTEENFTGGVMMNGPESSATYATTGTVKFGTQSETNLERFIVAKTGPLSFNDKNQYVGLHFYHPVGRIYLELVTHVRSDGSYENIQKATLTFPNLPKSATLDVLKATTTPYTDVLIPSEEETGITWKWEKEGDANGSGDLLYVYPFTFYDDKIESDYEQPGYFTIQIQENPDPSNPSTTVTKVYSGLLATSGESETGAVQLKGNQCLHIRMQVADGSGTGIYSYITDWNTEPMENVPQHRVPGIYTQEDAEALLNALLNDTDIPAYLIDGEEGDTQTIRFFTHVNWESLLDEEEVESITIPQEYILDGQGYNLTLPKDVNLYGVKGEGEGEDEAGNIKHLYVNGDEYTVVEEPDPDTEPDEGTGEDGTGGTGNPDAGTTPGTPGTEDPTTGDNTANT